MRDHYEIADRVFRRGDGMIAEKKRRSAIIRRTACAVSGICAAAVIGLGIWHSSAIKGALTPDPDHGYADIIDTELPETTTAPPAAATSRPTTSTHTTAASQGTTSAITSGKVSTETSAHTAASTTAAAAYTTTFAPETTGHDVTSPTPQTPSCFCRIEHNGLKYWGFETETSPDNIGGPLGTATLDLDYRSGYKGKNERFKMESGLYEVKGLSPDFYLAANYDGAYYLYFNRNYSPATMGEFIEGCGLSGMTTERALYYGDLDGKYVQHEYTGLDGDYLMAKIMTDPDIPAFTDVTVNTALSFTVKTGGVLDMTVPFWLSKDGWLGTNLIPSGIAFYIGEDKAREIINDLTENYPHTDI